MKNILKIAAITTLLATAALAPCVAFAAEGTPAAGSAQSSPDYKIGVVDIDEVLKQYGKLNTQVEALGAEKDKMQKELDAKGEALQKEQEALTSVPESEREARFDAIQKKKRDFTADFQRMQGELEDKRIKLLARTRQDVINTIQQIGSDEKFHLILQGDPNGRSAVIYFSTPINITPRVIEKLNGAAPATAAPTGTPATAAPKRER